MTRTRTVLLVLALLPAFAAPAASAADRLGTPEVLMRFGLEGFVQSSFSAEGHGEAFAAFHRRIGANVYTVAYRTAGGRLGRFDLPGTRLSFPQAIRFVALEDGATMALWDDTAGRRVLGRAWTADGDLGPLEVVLRDVNVVHSADNETAQWQVRSDRAGTVVVASTGAAPNDKASVLATVRDPGAGFGPARLLWAGGEPELYQRQVRISPIAADGTFLVAWGPEYGDGAGGRAIRPGRAATFGPASPARFVADRGLSAATPSAVLRDGEPVVLAPELARRCPCLQAAVLRWPGVRRLAVLLPARSDDELPAHEWFVARPGPDGAFGAPRRATRTAGAKPVRGARPGEVGFARFDTETDFTLFRSRSRLIVMPFGPRVPRSRRAPVLHFGTTATRRGKHLLVPVYCDRVCTVRGRSAAGNRLRVVAFRGTTTRATREPFDVVHLRVPLRPGAGRVAVTASATDDARHTRRRSVGFTRERQGRSTVWERRPG